MTLPSKLTAVLAPVTSSARKLSVAQAGPQVQAHLSPGSSVRCSVLPAERLNSCTALLTTGHTRCGRRKDSESMKEPPQRARPAVLRCS